MTIKYYIIYKKKRCVFPMITRSAIGVFSIIEIKRSLLWSLHSVLDDGSTRTAATKRRHPVQSRE